MECLLLPCLQYAPQPYISDIIQERAKDLSELVNTKLGDWPPLRYNPASLSAGLQVLRHVAAFVMCQDIPEAEPSKQEMLQERASALTALHG